MGVVVANLAKAAAPLAQPGAKTFDLALVDVRPELVKAVAPDYPYRQSRVGLVGTVKVAFVVDQHGCGGRAYVVESNNPAFDRSALDAVLAWKFKPGRKDGQPVNTVSQQTISYELDPAGELPWPIKQSADQAGAARHFRVPRKEGVAVIARAQVPVEFKPQSVPPDPPLP